MRASFGYVFPFVAHPSLDGGSWVGLGWAITGTSPRAVGEGGSKRLRTLLIMGFAGCCIQYADETACLYASQLLDGTTADMTVAVVSTPSVFVAMKNLLVSFPYPSCRAVTS